MFTADQKTILAIIVLVYFLFLVLLAYTINRRVKTYEDYSVAGRSVSVFPMILTLVGTAVGGATLLGYIANGYVLGMGQLWLGLVIVVPSIVIVTFMAGPIRRLGQHHNMVTLGDFTALVFGKKARIPTAISTLFAYCSITGMQFVAIATILSLTTGMNMTLGIVISWVMLTIKTVLGGMKTVVFQDALHGTIQTIGIFVLFVVVIVASGGWGTIEAKAAEVGDIRSLDFMNIPPSQLAVLFLTLGAYQLVRQDLWQRIWAAKTLKTLKVSFWIAIALQTALALIVVVLGVLAKFGLGIASEDPNLLYYQIVGQVFPFPLVVVMVIALLATVISTADSFFLAGSASIVNDILRPRLRDHNSSKLLTYSKLSVLITSVIAVLLALYIPQLILLWTTGTAMLVSGLLAPVILGLFWKGVAPVAGIASMWSGLGLAVLWQLLGEPLGWHPVFVGLPASILVLVVGSLLNRGSSSERSWLAISRDLPTEVPEHVNE